MASVGLVVNPYAARDVRRLVSLAPNLQLSQRVNVTARVLAGLAAAGVDEVLAMPEPLAVVDRAVALLDAAAPLPAVRTVDVPGDAAKDASGTRHAVTRMRERGVACVVCIGGDGTARAVAEAWPEVVLVPVAGGTNNAVAGQEGPEAVGLAAGRYATDPTRWAGALEPRGVLAARPPAGPDRLALADVALTRHAWTGSHAVWDPDRLVEVVLARSDPTVTGLAGLGGSLASLGPGEALHVRFGAGGRSVLAPLAPGRFASVPVRSWRVLGPGEVVGLRPDGATGTVAFDGERELVLGRGDEVVVGLRTAALRTLAVTRLLRSAAGAC